MEFLKGPELEELKREFDELRMEQKKDKIILRQLEYESENRYSVFLAKLHDKIKERGLKIKEIEEKIEASQLFSNS